MTSLQIPQSTSTVQVSIIDTSCRLRNVPTRYFFGPPLKGLETFDVVAYAFLITHTDVSTGKHRRIIFDLGPPKDWQKDLGEAIVDRVKGWGADIEISKYVTEILEENGVSPATIEAVIWSHAHWDHIGRPSLFPDHVALIADQAVKAAFYPGSPTVPESSILERDFAGRKLIELDFTTSDLVIGGFRAIDFFGDGSFYLLAGLGHAIGHAVGLARTTATAHDASKSTFILMAADSFHHGSQLRPNHWTPLPDVIPSHLVKFPLYDSGVPSDVFNVVHPSHPHRKAETPTHYMNEMAANHDDFKKTPFFTISSTPDGNSLAVDPAAAKDTIKRLQEFDGDENVLVVAAHDSSLFDLLEYFPRSANGWKDKGWKEKGRWQFLNDLVKPITIANGGVE